MAGHRFLRTEASSRDVGGRAVGIDLRGMAEVQAALRALGDGPASRKGLQQAAQAGARALKPYVQREAPKGASGRLRRSISARGAKRDRPAAVVSARPKVAFYRHMVIGGTKPHRIRFPDEKTRDVPRTQGSIQHPGARANPFIERGLDAGRAAAEAAIDEVLAAYVESL